MLGKNNQKFYLKLLPNSTLAKQRPSKVPLHYQKNKNLLDQMFKSGIIREMGNDTGKESEIFNPTIILHEGNTVKFVIDARNLSSIADLNTYEFPLKPIGTLLSTLKKN